MNNEVIMGFKKGFVFLDSIVIVIITGPWMASTSLTGYINLYVCF